METKLDSSIRLVMLQFSFTNPDVVPSCIKQLAHETQEEAVARKAMPIPGQPVIQPTEDASLAGLPSALEQVGYELVDAFYKPRINQESGRTYHMVRFVFAHHDYVNLSDEFKRVRNTIRIALDEVCMQAMWRVRSFVNPFFKNGTRCDDQNVLSLNFEARKPMFLPNGQPVVVWQRNGCGEKVGEAPLPLRAKVAVRVQDQVVQLLNA